MRTVAAALFVSLALGHPLAAQALFPSPLHIARQVVDPIGGKTTLLDEYGQGNRLISIAGPRTSIADYDKGELIEIDREAGTYSVTPFAAIARLAEQPGVAASKRANSGSEPRVESRGTRTTRSGRAAEVFEIRIDGEEASQTIEVAVDRTVRISKDALEALLGAAYPGVRRPEHDAILAAAAPGRSAASAGTSPAWGLPLEQAVRFDVDGRELEFRTAVVRVDADAPPPELVAIPPGAKRVVSKTVAVSQLLEEMDRPAPAPRR